MKRFIILFLLFYFVKGHCQYTEEKTLKIYVDKNELDTINKTGFISIKSFIVNELNPSEFDELYEIIGREKNQSSIRLNVNYKISNDGRIYFIKDCKGISKKPVPQELRGIPAYDQADYCNNQQLKDFINNYFNRKRIKYKFYENKELTNEITNLSVYSDYIFKFNFKFYLKKHYPLIIQNKNKI